MYGDGDSNADRSSTAKAYYFRSRDAFPLLSKAMVRQLFKPSTKKQHEIYRLIERTHHGFNFDNGIPVGFAAICNVKYAIRDTRRSLNDVWNVGKYNYDKTVFILGKDLKRHEDGNRNLCTYKTDKIGGVTIHYNNALKHKRIWISYRGKWYSVSYRTMKPIYTKTVSMMNEIVSVKLLQIKKSIEKWHEQYYPIALEEKKKRVRSFSAKTRMEVLKRDNFTCVLCGRTQKEDGVALQIDHIKPFSEGGETTIDNARTLCRECNIGSYHTGIREQPPINASGKSFLEAV